MPTDSQKQPPQKAKKNDDLARLPLFFMVFISEAVSCARTQVHEMLESRDRESFPSNIALRLKNQINK